MSKKKSCKNCEQNMTPDKKLEEIKKNTMKKLAKLFKLKTNEGCLKAVERLVALNAQLLVMITEFEFYVDLFTKLDKETLKEAEQKPDYVW